MHVTVLMAKGQRMARLCSLRRGFFACHGAVTANDSLVRKGRQQLSAAKHGSAWLLEETSNTRETTRRRLWMKEPQKHAPTVTCRYEQHNTSQDREGVPRHLFPLSVLTFPIDLCFHLCCAICSRQVLVVAVFACPSSRCLGAPSPFDTQDRDGRRPEPPRLDGSVGAKSKRMAEQHSDG
jgi:hypothetical protein